jgi:Brix domain
MSIAGNLGLTCLPLPLQLESVKYTRKNENVRPFEAGGEASLEFYCNRSNCSLFTLASHSKKRPHNLVIGRLFDFHLYDAIELGIMNYNGIKDFGAAATAAQMGNKVRAARPAASRILNIVTAPGGMPVMYVFTYGSASNCGSLFSPCSHASCLLEKSLRACRPLN